MCGGRETVLRGDLRPPLQGLPELFRVWGISGGRRRAPQAHILGELDVASRVSWEALVRPPGSCVSSAGPARSILAKIESDCQGVRWTARRRTTFRSKVCKGLPFGPLRGRNGSPSRGATAGRWGLSVRPGAGSQQVQGRGVGVVGRWVPRRVGKKFMIVCHRGIYLALIKGEGAARSVVPDRGSWSWWTIRRRSRGLQAALSRGAGLASRTRRRPSRGRLRRRPGTACGGLRLGRGR